MVVKEIIEKLKKYQPENEVVIFAAGDEYPILDIRSLDEEFGEDKVEIGCGWTPNNEI